MLTPLPPCNSSVLQRKLKDISFVLFFFFYLFGSAATSLRGSPPEAGGDGRRVLRCLGLLCSSRPGPHPSTSLQICCVPRGSFLLVAGSVGPARSWQQPPVLIFPNDTLLPHPGGSSSFCLEKAGAESNGDAEGSGAACGQYCLLWFE